eukprot:TRINITY_DN2506_c0_g2_i1.p1 TRINITY_DN2506_c0_g2~~TRINITY_DN2506_c0_g2_i1.p1  ORF type:complete len:112 (+),score=19.90 TRINITY_DN2506_c0_g2_i1:150-485(+)
MLSGESLVNEPGFNNDYFTKRANDLRTDMMQASLKCMAIFSGLLCLYRFSQRRQYYLTYIASIAKGSALGFVVSVHYNDKKLTRFDAGKLALLDLAEKTSQKDIDLIMKQK